MQEELSHTEERIEDGIAYVINQPQKKSNKLNIPIQAVGFRSFVQIAKHWHP